jgi:hypothetical protein
MRGNNNGDAMQAATATQRIASVCDLGMFPLRIHNALKGEPV